MIRQLARRSVFSAVILLGAQAPDLFAQAKKTDAPEPLQILANRPDKDRDELLGPVFESSAQGISVRPPAGSKIIRRAVASDEIAQFVNDEKGWIVKVSRAALRQPVKLVVGTEEKRKGEKGLLELTRGQFMDANPNAEILREDLIDIGQAKAGMLAVRYTENAQKRLMQQAIIREADDVYYVLTMTSIGAAKASAPGEEPDPKEKEAVETFKQMVDSVKLSDRAAVIEDQKQRLFRTRAFYVNLKADRIRQVLVKEQFLRLIRDGKDIGYTYITEDVRKRNNVDSVFIGIRSHTEPQKDVKVDAESWLISSLDRRHEEWSIGALSDVNGKKEPITEIGSSDMSKKRVFAKDEELIPTTRETGPKTSNVRPVDEFDTYSLSVNLITRAGAAEPIKRNLPPFYLPQAIGQLLPRLLPLTEQKTYMFATWTSDQHEVVARYVDVGAIKPVTLAGKTYRAAPIRDHLGLEGAATTHYVTAEGEYIGSVSEETGVTILVSNRASLMALWKDAKLTPPGDGAQPPAQKKAPTTAP